jgi:hypothetical protein
VQRHLGGDFWQRLHQEVGCAHPGLDGAEWVLDHLASLAHLLRMLIEPRCTASRTCSCSHRLIRRSLAVVQLCLMAQRLNLKAAKALGLTISPALLVQADKIIE